MRTISEEEFRVMCEQVGNSADSILPDVPTNAEKTDRLLRALFERVCLHLGLTPAEQEATLGGTPGFGLMQTLEEHMAPEFSYTDLIDRYLLMRLCSHAKAEEKGRLKLPNC